MITKILQKPVSLAQHVVGGVARGGLHGAVAVIKKVMPDDGAARTKVTRPTVSTEPVTQPPSPSTTEDAAKAATGTPAKKAPAKQTAAKKAPPKKTAAKKTTAKKAAPKKPAAVLDEPPAPVDDDPVVYSAGPDVATSVPKDDLDELDR